MPAVKRKTSQAANKPIQSIAFGSCNRQDLKQELWDVITSSVKPEVWLWTGDAVYTDVPGTVEQVQEAYAQQLQSQEYQKFLATGVDVTAVYDDHDWGVNDAGCELDRHRERMDALLDFIGAEQDDPRRKQNALYTSHIYGPPGRQVKVIYLDTRAERDLFPYLNIGLQAPALQAISRMIQGSLCLGGDFKGDMLGAEQWAWLTQQLEHSTAAFHIIVSTVQVFTSNPIAESWGHFPAARQRLLQLLERTQPSGTMFISGDVHLAELLSGIPPQQVPAQHEPVLNISPARPVPVPSLEAASRPVLEVTSSGLTHSCAGRYGTFICSTMLNTWNKHRPKPDDYHFWQNFGSISFDWGDCSNMCNSETPGSSSVCAAQASFKVHDANGDVVLQTTRSSCDRWSLGSDINNVVQVLKPSGCLQARLLGAATVVAGCLLFKLMYRQFVCKAKKID